MQRLAGDLTADASGNGIESLVYDLPGIDTSLSRVDWEYFDEVSSTTICDFIPMTPTSQVTYGCP